MALQILYFVPGNLLDPEASFQAISQKLLVSPVLQTLVYTKNVAGSQDWIERMTSWSFKRVIPAHFAAPVAAGPKDLRSVIDADEQHCYVPCMASLTIIALCYAQWHSPAVDTYHCFGEAACLQ